MSANRQPIEVEIAMAASGRASVERNFCRRLFFRIKAVPSIFRR